jgi:nucleotide-binding universal stress UspA family protein
MKLLCPIDFSDAAFNGLEYAAHLAKALSAKLTIIYVRLSIWPEALPLEHEANESLDDIATRLQKIKDETHKEFGILCDHHVEITTSTFQEAIAARAKDYDLIIMGTNGSNNYYQYIFGSSTYQVIEKTKCPVLIVPQGYIFRAIRNIVYAYDPSTNPIFLIDQLKKLVIPIRASVRILHISEDKASAETEHKLEALREAVRARALRNNEWIFDCTYSKDVSWAIDQYMKNHNADILALSFHHRTLKEKFFNENVIKQITMILEYPAMIFWH